MRFASMSQDERSHLQRLAHAEQVQRNAHQTAVTAPFPHLRSAMVLSNEFPSYLTKGSNTGY